MNKYFTLLLLSLSLFSCKKENTPVLRETMSPQLVSDDIITTMPGRFIVTDKYLVWEDPFARDYFVHVHDKLTGEKLGMMGKVGEGPEEFISGGISNYCIDNRFRAVDANGNTEGYLSIDSLLLQKKTFIPLSEKEKKELPKMAQVEKGLFIGHTEDGSDTYFAANVHGKESKFGVYPIPEVKKHVGGYQAYDAQSGLFAYCSFKFPYLALYKRRDHIFELQWEYKPEKVDYQIREDRLVIDRKRGGIAGISLCKDYIVALQRDRENDPMDESTVGRNASKCPRTVFLYDYDSHLVKIVDLGMPIIRIAADRKSNTLYAIGVNPDYILAKYEL